MYNKVKLSKRQIKEDKFTTFMLTYKKYAAENWQYFAMGAIGLVLVVFAVIYFANSAVEKESEAATRFSQALLEYRNGNNQVAILSLTQIVDEYAGNDVAQQATFLLGRLNFEIRNYTESQRYYQMYLDKHPNDPTFRSAAYDGIASGLENLGQYAEAAEYYVRAYDEMDNAPMAGDYLISAMRNYLAVGDREKAQTYLKILESEFDGTTLANRATRLFAEKTVE